MKNLQSVNIVPLRPANSSTAIAPRASTSPSMPSRLRMKEAKTARSEAAEGLVA
eukprot:CAMPEP_0119379446 /NCGR_PEP_ID=MMETSP1334-20130426/52718_1 /TAXON_ID=127549 /ORGANISM="Calcidiscus leptoporus, Strain RCC1130" /LENGTH=53 /DNA_ID=CAMNT_0007398951 /DNA_START=409 /DNA_END=570 /DNA_ORIENTATION=+